jgi:hypothetical protein
MANATVMVNDQGGKYHRPADPTDTLVDGSGSPIGGGGGGASTGDAFVTIGHPGDLTAERSLAVTAADLTLTDGGANNDVTLGLAAAGSAGTYVKVTTDAKGRVTSGLTAITEAEVTNLVSDLAGKQVSDATLTALAGLDATAGLVEQTGADAFTKRALGVGAGTSVPTRADADTRYAAASHGHAEADVTGLVADLAAKQALDATLTALAGLDATAGLVEQTGADAFTKRALGVAAGTSIPTRADADARYNPLATGTPDGTKFLRDDNSWQVPSGGSGGPLAFSDHILSSNLTVTAGKSAYVSRYLEIAAGVTVEIGALADLEIG